MSHTQLGAGDLGPFLHLPREIRDAIYTHAIDWPDLSRVVPKGAYGQGPLWKRAQASMKLSTLALLLTNKQVSAEAIQVLHSKPLILEPAIPFRPLEAEVLDYRVYISERTLQNVQTLVVRMDLLYHEATRGSAFWFLKIASILLEIWSKETKLEKVIIQAPYQPLYKATPWNLQETIHHRAVIRIIEKLKGFKNQASVIFDCEIRL